MRRRSLKGSPSLARYQNKLSSQRVNVIIGSQGTDDGDEQKDARRQPWGPDARATQINMSV